MNEKAVLAKEKARLEKINRATYDRYMFYKDKALELGANDSTVSVSQTAGLTKSHRDLAVKRMRYAPFNLMTLF